jgi:hypothetical protein
MCQHKKIPLSITPKGKVLKQAVRVITTFRLVLFWLSGELPQRCKQKLFVKEDTLGKFEITGDTFFRKINPLLRLTEQYSNLFDAEELRIHTNLLGFPLPPLLFYKLSTPPPILKPNFTEHTNITPLNTGVNNASIQQKT